MNEQKMELNTALVDLFNQILKQEERHLAKGSHKDLSVSEIHLLDMARTGPEEEPLTMARLAGRVGISAGSLTVAVKALEQKGYICRRKSETDRRRVLVELTEKGAAICRSHQVFHEKMVQALTERLTAPQLDALCRALAVLDDYFKSETAL